MAHPFLFDSLYWLLFLLYRVHKQHDPSGYKSDPTNGCDGAQNFDAGDGQQIK